MYIHNYFYTISLALLFLLAPSLSQALTVTNLNDSGPGSLRDAVAGTAPGGTVDFDVTGTIVLSSEIVIDKDITIQGPGANLLTVSGGDATRVFHITGGFDITINHIRIADGFTSNEATGGAAFLFLLDNVNMELNDCIVEDNMTFTDSGSTQGVISLLRTSLSGQFLLKVNRCSFINNVAEAEGLSGAVIGSVFSSGTGRITLEVYDSLFKGNRAEGASLGLGGVLAFATFFSDYKFRNSTFESNTVRGGVTVIGGVIGDGASNNTFDCTNCTFYDNRAECAGGNCSIVIGGAMGSASSSEYRCNFCTFKSNRAICGGNNCLQAGDTIAPSLRSPDSDQGGTVLSNSIIYADIPEDSCTSITSGNIISLGYNIDNGNSCVNGSVAGDKPFTDSGLDPAGLQYNGGPTPTIALLQNSLAIDMADPACPPPGTDQRGVVRPQLVSCDIGAYEFNLITRPIPTLSEWGLVAMAAVLGIIGLFAVRKRKAAV